MNHLTEDILFQLAEHYAGGLPYTAEEREALQHIGECEQCYNDFCCAAAVQNALSPWALAEALPHPDDMFAAAPAAAEDILTPKAVIHVLARKIADAVTVTMEQLNDTVTTWFFEPSLAAAGARDISDSKASKATASLEDVDSRYTFIRYNAETGELHIQIDTEEAAEIPERIFLKYADGKTEELTLERGDRFIIADVKDVASDDFEVILA